MDPPSFSLGLDLDAFPLHQHFTPPPDPTSSPSFDAAADGDAGAQVKDSEDEDEEPGPMVLDSDPEPEPDPPRALKRLRRGPVTGQPGAKKKRREAEAEMVGVDTGDDDIEEFSSEEGFVIQGRNTPTQFNSICSTSKPSLRGSGILSTQSSSLPKMKKQNQASNASALSSLEKERSGLVFPKLTVSPLRRFQLIDSDSDLEEPSTSKNVSERTPKMDSLPKDHRSTGSDRRTNVMAEKHLNEDLWKDFCPVKSLHIPTPVLDEVCNEYFQSVKGKNAANNLSSDARTGASVQYCQNASGTIDFEPCRNLSNPAPPANHYFFHGDPRVQKLVRNRLPNFFPLGLDSSRGNQLPTDSVIDYRCQFDGEASKKKGTPRNNRHKGSATVRNKSKKSNAREDASEGWVDPSIRNTIPKDAGKRRIVANGQAAAGRWYTSPEGRKVYVSRSGQESTGQAAYRNYKKDNGGFRKPRKKTNTKSKKS
ncbi:hypothetical protein Tsubulata_012776 [Turnera subulata]|uniref:Uncharacterized protein n=1 Tax=Turnera subulata TaxID=218843 RepID=A0A9Q0JDP9_9ROSI|nr:hypothetical protein Tsubulata_012776 [Turnera subulata]